MHVPDGLINAGTSIGAGVAAAGGLVTAVRGKLEALDSRLPLAGLTAALIFALQMLNFPVLPGVSGHVMGGALAAILLGPRLGMMAVSVVVIVQAVLFADGGLTALGINVINMAILTTLSGWVVFRVFATLRVPGLLAAAIASWASVVASAGGFVLEYSIGGTGGVDAGTLLPPMLGVHAVIGIGEGLITAAVLGAVAARRPDIVVGFGGAKAGARGLSGRTAGGFVLGGMAAAAALIVFLAPLAAPTPDGLEAVASDIGIAETVEPSIIGGPLADYTLAGRDNALGTIGAGLAGLAATFAIGLGLASLRRRRTS